MVRQEQKGLELTAEGLASASKSLLRGENKGFRVPSFGHGAAAQDDDVPHGALGGLDGACSHLVATIGDVADHDERVGRRVPSPRSSPRKREGDISLNKPETRALRRRIFFDPTVRNLLGRFFHLVAASDATLAQQQPADDNTSLSREAVIEFEVLICAGLFGLASFNEGVSKKTN